MDDQILAGKHLRSGWNAACAPLAGDHIDSGVDGSLLAVVHGHRRIISEYNHVCQWISFAERKRVDKATVSITRRRRRVERMLRPNHADKLVIDARRTNRRLRTRAIQRS